MMFEEAGDVLRDVANEIGVKVVEKNMKKKSAMESLCSSIQRVIKRNPQTERVVLILDEIDRIAEDDPDLLGRLLAWCCDHTNNLIIIGIANSIDLTHRYIPPSILPMTETCFFPPYQMEDITAILTDRLQTANHLIGSQRSLIQPIAIELCARKIAAMGDLRKALEVMQLAIDVAQLDFESKGPGAVAQVEFVHVIKAMERALPSNSSQASSGNALTDQLNINSKLVLVALILFQRENPVPVGTRLPYKRATLQALYESYVRMLRGGDMSRGAMLMEPVGRDEFLVLLSDLETFGILTIANNSQSGAKRTTGRAVGMGQLLDWQGSIVKFAVPDLGALVETLKKGAVTNMFIT